MLVYRRDDEVTEHRVVADLPTLLRPDDLMVLNETKVVPARLYASKPGGGRAELLLLEREPGDEAVWACLGRASRGFRGGQTLVLGDSIEVRVLDRDGEGRLRVRFESDAQVERAVHEYGVMPLPPYIRRGADDGGDLRRFDRERYQTVYAREPGAVAAPTAGLHFTDLLLEQIRARGVDLARITLHVGVGTFAPVKTEDAADHVMHEERYVVPVATAEAIDRAKSSGRRVVAVGTTVCRTLESAWDGCVVRSGPGRTRLFITPGYRFNVVDALMTNFHLPRSTLLMLISALAGREKILELYATAIRERYRFFSYGDAMLIL